MKQLVWLFCVVMFACSNNEKKEVKTPIDVNNANSKIAEDIKEKVVPDSINNQRIGAAENDFLKFYKEFTSALISKKDSAINVFIHPNFGIYFIESKGALPTLTQFYNYSEFDHKESIRLVFELLDSTVLLPPKMELLPKVICDKEVYDKQGCFAQEINPLLESRIWNYAGLNEKQLQAIEFLAETVNITIINTSNFIFYFSKIEGKWYLTFLDLRTPCSA